MTRWKLWTGAVLVILLLSATTVGAGKVTLTVWHPFGPSGHPGGGDLFNKLVGEFEASHPNVKIQTTLYGVLELRQKMQVALPAGTEPDIWFGGPAAATLGRFAQAGYLADLTPYYEKYGWKPVTLQQGLKYVSYKGRYYGVPHNPDLMVIYYNKDAFKANGWEVPNTYTEFLTLAKAIRAKGMAPILFGNRDGWPGVNLLTVFLDFQGALESYDKALFGDGRFDISQFVAAAKHFVELKELGVFNEDLNALSAYEASALFCKGKSPMFLQGTWQMSGVVSDAKFDVGMLLLPTNDPKKRHATIASYGPYFAVSAKCPQMDMAAEFLNFVVYENARAWYEKTFVAPSVRIDLEGIDFYHPLAKKRGELVNEYLARAVFDLHVTLPTSVSQYAYGGIQAMLDRQLTPEAFWTEVQRRWEKEKKAGTIWQP